MEIVKATSIDHVSLTEITVASKSYWNYSKSQIEEWLPVLTISEEYIQKNEVYKLVAESETIAYYSYYSNSKDEVLLDNLFVSPDFIGKGLGGMLLNDFVKRIQVNGANKVLIYSDPNAEGFYQNFGFEVIGQEKTSIEGRFLPIMTLNI